MSKSFNFQVLTPTEALRDLQGITHLRCPLADGGSIGILPGHAPLIAETVAGTIHYEDDQGQYQCHLQAGILQITTTAVVIFTAGAQGDTHEA